MNDAQKPVLTLYQQLLVRDRRRILLRRRLVAGMIAACLAIVLGVGGWVAVTAVGFNMNLHRSGALEGNGTPKLSRDTNILLMGLDSRLDENGKALPPEIYDALHAGDNNSGGYNSNVLMLIHIPADGSKATGISIPRDDYVQTAGFDGAGFNAKIKEAYGYGFAAAKTAMINQGKPDNDATYQSARDSGRRAEIATVSKFLGNSLHIDHFVEVTMAAFYQIAQSVAPITVCVNKATHDTYSGADFRQGMQQIDAKQAIAFVRQRRDTTDTTYNFTDLDRERRQQAFISAVTHQLKQAGTFTNLPEMQSVLNAVSKNIVVDNGLNLLQLGQQATSLTGGNISFTTLPITGFGVSPDGASINTVDVAQIQATVKDLLTTRPAALTADRATPNPPAATQATAAPPSGPAASAAQPNGPSGPPTTSPAHTYADWSGALQGGGVPCVK